MKRVMIGMVVFGVLSLCLRARAQPLAPGEAVALACGTGLLRVPDLAQPGGAATFELDAYGEVTRRDTGSAAFSFVVRARAGAPTPANLVARVEVLRGAAGARGAVYCSEVVVGTVYGLPSDATLAASDRAVITLFGAPTGTYAVGRERSATTARIEALATPALDRGDVRATVVHGLDLANALRDAAALAADLRGGTVPAPTAAARQGLATRIRTASASDVCLDARATATAVAASAEAHAIADTIADAVCVETIAIGATVQQLAVAVEQGTADEIDAAITTLPPTPDDAVGRICDRAQRLRWLVLVSDLRPLLRHELPAGTVEPVVVDYDTGASEPDRPSGEALVVLLRGAPTAGRLWSAVRVHPSADQEALEILGRLLAATITRFGAAPPSGSFCGSATAQQIDSAYPPLVPYGARTVHVGELSDDGLDVAVCNDATCPVRAGGDNVRNFIVVEAEHHNFSWTILAGLTVSFTAAEGLAQTFGAPEFQLNGITVDPAMDPMEPPVTNQHFVSASPYSAADLFAATLLVAMRWQPVPDGVTFLLGTGPALSFGAARFQWNVVGGVGFSHGVFLVLGLGLGTSRVPRGGLASTMLTVPLGTSAPAIDVDEAVAAMGTVGFAIDLEGLGDVGAEIVKAFGGGA